MNLNKKYLKLLKTNYDSKQAICKEIINLSAITNLPKGTEYFMSDLHGEYNAFLHILNNCSGVVKEKVDLLFKDSVSDYDRQELCTLIYYPEQKLAALKKNHLVNVDWYKETLNYLIQIAKLLSSKYTRSKVRKALPNDFAYIIDELLHAQEDEDSNQFRYHAEILNSIIELNNADQFIIALSDLIKRLAVDHLHIVGDIYDRGGCADKILDLLMNYHSIDIEWGNHDMLWMGAAGGNDACIITVIYNNLKYGNTEILEHAYGISLRPLITYAVSRYNCDDPIEAAFMAAKVLLFKMEGIMIQNHPEYKMDGRLLLNKINCDSGQVEIDGKNYLLKFISGEDADIHTLMEQNFPTVDWNDPYALTDEEEKILNKLHADFITSANLKKHIQFLYDKGGMYRIYNGNLLYHGCVPLDENGNFDYLDIFGERLHGRALFDKCDEIARTVFQGNASQEEIDFMWFLWTGEKSPLCGRKIKTFEHEFIEDKEACKEPSNPYYRHYYKETICEQILREFGLYSKDSHIINGHTPVHEIEGEEPIRANGRLFVIDGGFCRPMNKKTGIAGYTLIFNSHYYRLKAHTPFTSVEDVINNNADIDDSENKIVSLSVDRLMVKDTDTGIEILNDIEDLRTLLEFYDEV